MTTFVPTSGGRFSWPDLWWLPFLWILLIPMMTMPIQVERLGSDGGFASAKAYQQCQLVHKSPGAFLDFNTVNSWRCPAEDVLATLAPGLLNLAPLLWVWWPNRRTRFAVLAATGLGAARVLVPGLIYLALGTVTFSTHFFPGPNETVIASLTLWFLSSGAAVVFPWLVKAGRSS